jgi:ribonuclease HII
MRWIVGIDEVGRGALAGPVVVAAAMLAINSDDRGEGLKDSKQLSARQRERWAKKLRSDPKVRFAVARVYPRGIERMNISGAANRAALRAFSRLSKANNISPGTPVFLDGGLFLGSKVQQNQQRRSAKTMPKADEKIPAVAVASIIAKVARDRFMVKLAKKYPYYGFEAHKGYGTATHFKALKKQGSCAAHRLTFLAKRPSMNR